MPLSKSERLNAALNMIKVTPENYKDLNPDMILHLCEVITEAEKKYLIPTEITQGR